MIPEVIDLNFFTVNVDRDEGLKLGTLVRVFDVWSLTLSRCDLPAQ
jgi:hypothetical protein